MTAQLARACGLVIAWAILVGSAQAQPISTTGMSVELQTAVSERVVRAIVEEIAPHELADGLYPGSGIRRYQTLTIRVLETLKGEPAETIQFVADGDFGPHSLADWKANRQELLIFFQPWRKSGQFSPSRGGYAYTRFPLMASAVIVFQERSAIWAHTSLPVMNDQVEPLKRAKAVIETVQAFVKQHPQDKAVRGAIKTVPAELRSGFHQASLAVTIDQPQEASILEWDAFCRDHGQPAPQDKKPALGRTGGGYVGVPSLEWMAAESELIVRGIVEEHCFVAESGDGTGDMYGIRFRVRESFRGSAPEYITCLLREAADLETLQANKQQIVLFLTSNRNDPRDAPVGSLEYRTIGLWNEAAIVLDADRAEVLFADLTWHRKPEEILARLRKLPDDQPLTMLSIHPPASLVEGTTLAGNPHTMIFLPVDKWLEANARRWAQSDDPDLRWMATRSLLYFRSDENAALLRTLLNDPATWPYRAMLAMTDLDYPYEPNYLVRWEAWHTLQGWGYEAPRPEFKSDQE